MLHAGAVGEGEGEGAGAGADEVAREGWNFGGVGGATTNVGGWKSGPWVGFRLGGAWNTGVAVTSVGLWGLLSICWCQWGNAGEGFNMHQIWAA